VNGDGPSRGELPVKFVSDSEGQPPAEFLRDLAAAAHEYSPFNLLVADLTCSIQEHQSQLWYLTNSSTQNFTAGTAGLTSEPASPEVRCVPIPVEPGVHGVSNASLDTPWPKIILGRKRLEEMAASGAFDAEESFPWDRVFDFMHDSSVLESDVDKLPDTGYGPELETAASALFVEPIDVGGLTFGTRSMTILTVRRDGVAELRERYLVGGSEAAWAEERHQFHTKVFQNTVP